MRPRTITKTRRVPHTVDGETRLVEERYTLPAPPRDWDHIVLTGALAVVAAGLLIVIVWSTASIGDLLVLTDVTPAIAYAAATGFSLGWLVCMALEWLNRYDPTRVRRPRTAGHVFLTADMAAVCVHGWIADSLKVGIIGAVLSAGAKALYTLILDHQAAPLDFRTQQWVAIRRGEINSRLALGAARRQLSRVESRAAAEEAALLTAPDAEADPDPDSLAEVTPPAGAPILPSSGPMTVKDAVTTARSCGITDQDAVLRYVRKVADANAKGETVARYLRGA
ncbi:protein transporter Sec31 [Streptomyces sp. CC208A]|uniref:protein transporter Sec31 n=1 Tax=Streptomyces sp. CC208A TaxID=3044573 RepID=UPI0024A8A7B4|nr:protein transporter Sec31 [Streptomyces sp. CC208A]